MVWCEENRLDYVFGLARNSASVGEIATRSWLKVEANRQAAR